MHGTPLRLLAHALLASSLLLAACGSDETGGPSAEPTFLEGVWTGCFTQSSTLGTFDVKATLSFAGDGYGYDLVGYATSTDGTCAGTGVLVDSGQGTFTVGADIQAPLGAGTVTAKAIDLRERPSSSYYTLAYVDTSAEPDRLYTNLDLASTPQTRPVTLEEDRPLRRQQ